MVASVRNYTTSIPVRQTVGEVIDLLARHGADQVMLRYDGERQPCGVAFSIASRSGPASYVLPVDAARVLARLQQQKAANPKLSHPTADQAARVAWRTVQDWLESQLELIANELVTLDRVMLPFRVVDAAGTTVYDALAARDFRLPALPESVGDARR